MTRLPPPELSPNDLLSVRLAHLYIYEAMNELAGQRFNHMHAPRPPLGGPTGGVSLKSGKRGKDLVEAGRLLIAVRESYVFFFGNVN